MSSSERIETLPKALAWSAIPIAAAAAAAYGSVALTTRFPVEIAAALLIAVLTVVVIRTHPLQTVMVFAVTRAGLEYLSGVTVLSVAGVQLSPPDLVTLALLAGGGWWLLSRVVTGAFDWHAPTCASAAFFIGLAGLSLLYSPDWALGARDLLKFCGAYCTYLVVMNSRPTPRQLRWLLALVVASSVVPMAIGWYQFTHSIGQSGLYRGGLRIQATFDHPNTYGFYLVSVLAASWGLLNAISGKKRLWAAAAGLIAFVSAFTTLSRNTWIAMGLLALVIGWRQRRVWVAALTAASGVFVAMPRTIQALLNLFNPRTGSNQGNSLLGRLDLWQQDLEAWRSAPITGNGWGSTQTASGALAHNDYLRALGEGGLIGLTSFLFLLGSLLRASWRAATGRSDLPWAFLGLTLGYVAVSAASNNIGKGAFQFYFWLLAAISFLWHRTVPPSELASVATPQPLDVPPRSPSPPAATHVRVEGSNGRAIEGFLTATSSSSQGSVVTMRVERMWDIDGREIDCALADGSLPLWRVTGVERTIELRMTPDHDNGRRQP
jgi:putative inorganic carbon (hco3(-)) transporter